jgi:hypothetical protein
MISPGFETTDPITKTRFVVMETSARGWVLEHQCTQGAAAMAITKTQTTWSQKF